MSFNLIWNKFQETTLCCCLIKKKKKNTRNKSNKIKVQQKRYNNCWFIRPSLQWLLLQYFQPLQLHRYPEYRAGWVYGGTTQPGCTFPQDSLHKHEPESAPVTDRRELWLFIFNSNVRPQPPNNNNNYIRMKEKEPLGSTDPFKQEQTVFFI